MSTLVDTHCPSCSPHFSLGGPTEYLEDLVARIDAPLLDDGHLEPYGNPIRVFDTPRVPWFIY